MTKYYNVRLIYFIKYIKRTLVFKDNLFPSLASTIFVLRVSSRTAEYELEVFGHEENLIAVNSSKVVL